MSIDDDSTRDLTSGPGDQSSDRSIEQWKTMLSAEDHADLKPGDQVGPFKIVGALGEGGFGRVWLAERRDPFFQRVALKVLKRGMDSRAVLARFEQERQALALMDHPGIAKVVDGGTTDSGQPYFVMEYVKGEPLTQYCDRHHMTIADRLGLFVLVCEAVQHAHIKGIIHRDIKPSNILVEVVDGKPVPKVIDFGVAKALGQALSAHTVFTSHGQMVGTPEYMSPEQAEGAAAGVDTRTDVYSLGIVLYELLAGTLPFEAAELRNAGAQAVHRIIREQEAPKPSTKLQATGDRATAVAQRRSMKLDTLRGTLSRELEWIPMKAIRKDPDRRYRSPDELALDVRNYLEGRGLIAGPETISYRARKAMRRHWRPLAAVAAVMLALGAGMTWALVERGKAITAERAAVAERTEAEKQRDEAERARTEAQEQRDQLLTRNLQVMQVLEARYTPDTSGQLDIASRLKRIDFGSLSTDAVGRSTFSVRLAAAKALAMQDAVSAAEYFDKLRAESAEVFGPEASETDQVRCGKAICAAKLKKEDLETLADDLADVAQRQDKGKGSDAAVAGVLNWRGTVLLALGRTDEAARVFEASHARLQKAGRSAEAIPVADNLAAALLQGGKMKEALGVADRTIDALRGGSDEQRFQLPFALRRKGEALIGLQRYPEAVTVLQSAATKELELPRPRFELATDALTLAAEVTSQTDVKARLRTMTLQFKVALRSEKRILASRAAEVGRQLAASLPANGAERKEFEAAVAEAAGSK